MFSSNVNRSNYTGTEFECISVNTLYHFCLLILNINKTNHIGTEFKSAFQPVHPIILINKLMQDPKVKNTNGICLHWNMWQSLPSCSYTGDQRHEQSLNLCFIFGLDSVIVSMLAWK